MIESTAKLRDLLDRIIIYTIPDPGNPCPPKVANDLTMIEGLAREALRELSHD